jgi:ParB family transcriptional regulator, chromosome partitioning protein
MALGKSLGNILGDYFGDEVVELNAKDKGKIQIGNEEVKNIPIKDIKLSPFQTRRLFKKEKVISLAESIRNSGLIHPVIVVLKTPEKAGDKEEYTLVAGERRLRAVQYLGSSEIMAMVKKESLLDDSQHAMLTAMENLEREDLNPIELANTFVMLMQTQIMDEHALADMLQVSFQYVRNYLRLLQLSEPVQEALQGGLIGEGQARHLTGLSEARQREMLKLIVEKQLTVKEIEAMLAAKPKAGKPIAVVSHNISKSYISKAQSLVTTIPNSKMRASGNDKHGRIVISW